MLLTCASTGIAYDSAVREQRKLMQDNYVKLQPLQVPDLVERGGRGSVLGSSSSQPYTDFHSVSGVLGHWRMQSGVQR